MHKDKMTVTVPDLSHIAPNMDCLMCCGNCTYEEICPDTEGGNQICERWFWDKLLKADWMNI